MIELASQLKIGVKKNWGEEITSFLKKKKKKPIEEIASFISEDFNFQVKVEDEFDSS